MAKRSKSKRKAQKGGGATSASTKVKSSYYSVLGVRPGADAGTIRARYLELVREFTPERAAEAFQDIRAAYEVLSDPKSRQMYDRQRFHGTTAEALRKKIDRARQRGRLEEGIRLLRVLVDIQPSSEHYLELALCYEVAFDPEKADEMYRRALDAAESDEERTAVLIKMAHRSDDDFEIIDALLQVAEECPKSAKPEIARDLLSHYVHVGQVKKGMAFYAKLISRKRYPSLDDFNVYLQWLKALNDLELYREWKQLLANKMKPAASRAAGGPDTEAIRDRLVEFLNQVEREPNPELHLAVADMARTIAPEDDQVRGLWREFADTKLLNSQVSRLISDARVPNWMAKNLLDWYRSERGIMLVEGDRFMSSRVSAQALPAESAVDLIRRTYPRLYHALGPKVHDILALPPDGSSRRTP